MIQRLQIYADAGDQAVISVSINEFNVLGGNWDPTDKKFSVVN